MKNTSSSKTVYFLGAGMSAASDFNLPCLRDFFKGTFKKEKYPDLCSFIEKHFPDTKLEALNLEEVVTFLDLSIDEFGRFGNEVTPNLYNARNEFSKLVYDRLSYGPIGDRNWCGKHKRFLEKLNEQDSIITLNYDLILENTLFEVQKFWKPEDSKILHRMYALLESTTRLFGGDRPTIYEKHKSLGHLLKLHGSINWFYCPREMCTHHQAFYPDWIHEKTVLTSPGDLCKACGTPLAPVIIPPTISKSFLEFPKLGFLWSLAYRELNKADKIVIMGVSFTPSDYYLSWLFKSAIAERENNLLEIEIVNKDRGVCNRVKDITGIIPKFKGDLDEYIANIKTN